MPKNAVISDFYQNIVNRTALNNYTDKISDADLMADKKNPERPNRTVADRFLFSAC